MAQLGKLIKRLPLPLIPPNLKIGREIDRGAWGAVYEGQLDGLPVAVKKVHELLKEPENGDEAVHSFFEECERLKELEHPHVIKFRGAFEDAETGPILVMERMSENLRRFLERCKHNLTIQDQLRISLEITKGVAFLHQLDPPMVHRDLNDKNVMFSFEGVAKLGDFGQSKLKQDLYLTTTAPGMVSFMPPECLRAEGARYDESLDVFSLGVLLLEIGTQQVPAPNIEGIGTIREVKRREKDLQKMCDSHPFKPFIVLCLNDDRRQRPKAAELEVVFSRLDVNILQTLLAAERRFHSELEASQQSYERARRAEARYRKLQTQHAALQILKQKYKIDCNIVEEHLTASEMEKRNMQKDLDHAKAEIANRDVTIRQLQERCDQLVATVKEKDQQFSMKQEEAKDYEAKYHVAESKRLVAVGQVCELTLVMNGEEPKQKAGKKDSKTELRQKYHLAQKDNETLENLCQWHIQEFQWKLEAREREIIELRNQLAEAQVVIDRARVLSSKEGTQEYSFTGQHFDAPQQFPPSSQSPVAMVVPVEASRVPTPRIPEVPGPDESTVFPPVSPTIAMPKLQVDSSTELQQATKAATLSESLQGQDKEGERPSEVASQKPTKPVARPRSPRPARPKSFTFNEGKQGQDKESEQHSEVASSKPVKPVAKPRSLRVATPNSPSAATPTLFTFADGRHGQDKMSEHHSKVASNAQHHNLQEVDDSSADDVHYYKYTDEVFPGGFQEGISAEMANQHLHTLETTARVATKPKPLTLAKPKLPSVHVTPPKPLTLAKPKLPLVHVTPPKPLTLAKPKLPTVNVTAQHHNLQPAGDDSDGHSPEYDNVMNMELHCDADLTESTIRAPMVASHKPPAGPTEATVSPSRNASRVEPQVAATEDLPSCEQCGRTFPWNQLHLRWKHKCEPAEVSLDPNQPRKRSKSSAPDFEYGRPANVSKAAAEELSSSMSHSKSKTLHTAHGQACPCGLAFDNGREFVAHVLTCSKGTPLVSHR